MNKEEKYIFERVSELQVKPTKSKQQAWEMLDKKVSQKQTSRRIYLAVSSAAAVLVLAFFVFMQEHTNEIKTGFAESQSIVLPDNSKVTLHASSTLRYKPKNWLSDRKLELEGEAFFEIEKGKQLRVISSNGEVRVLGTTFDVYSRKENFEAQCFTGKIEVSRNGNTQLLLPGEGVKAFGKTSALHKYSFEIPERPAWMSGSSAFRAVPLQTVFDEIEICFGVTVQVKKDLNNRTYTGYFQHDDLNAALETICLAMGLDFTIEQKQVIIK